MFNVIQGRVVYGPVKCDGFTTIHMPSVNKNLCQWGMQSCSVQMGVHLFNLVSSFLLLVSVVMCIPALACLQNLVSFYVLNDSVMQVWYSLSEVLCVAHLWCWMWDTHLIDSLHALTQLAVSVCLTLSEGHLIVTVLLNTWIRHVS
jgi:hypothetical protein